MKLWYNALSQILQQMVLLVKYCRLNSLSDGERKSSCPLTAQETESAPWNESE